MPQIFLIGPMGAGKTTIAEKLADILKLPWLDSDHLLQSHTSLSITQFLCKYGVREFRYLEQKIITKYSYPENRILSLGGGAILSPITRSLLVERGIVIFLNSSVADLYLRLIQNNNRPLLQCNIDFINNMLNKREQLYLSIANLVIVNIDIDTTTRKIIDYVKYRCVLQP